MDFQTPLISSIQLIARSLSLPADWRDIFDPAKELIVTRAPGRLDLMGGIADYSGSLVLQLPIKAATHVALQRNHSQKIRHRQFAGSRRFTRPPFSKWTAKRFSNWARTGTTKSPKHGSPRTPKFIGPRMWPARFGVDE